MKQCTLDVVILLDFGPAVKDSGFCCVAQWRGPIAAGAIALGGELRQLSRGESIRWSSGSVSAWARSARTIPSP